jgi:PAP2 superfamily
VTFEPNGCMYTALAGAFYIEWARVRGRDVSGVPGVSLLLPVTVTIAIVASTLYAGGPSRDGTLLALDQALGLHWWMGRAFLAHPIFAFLCTTVYKSPGLAAAILYVALGSASERRRLALAIAVISVSGWCLYHIVPAGGPAYTYSSWPSTEPLGGQPTTTHGPLNCMPSTHFGWALLLLWFARHLSWRLRLSLAIFVVLTGCATLGLGEHYWVDLLAAVPFAAAIYFLCNRHPRLQPVLTTAQSRPTS